MAWERCLDLGSVGVFLREPPSTACTTVQWDSEGDVCVWFDAFCYSNAAGLLLVGRSQLIIPLCLHTFFFGSICLPVLFPLLCDRGSLLSMPSPDFPPSVIESWNHGALFQPWWLQDHPIQLGWFCTHPWSDRRAQSVLQPERGAHVLCFHWSHWGLVPESPQFQCCFKTKAEAVLAFTGFSLFAFSTLQDNNSCWNLTIQNLTEKSFRCFLFFNVWVEFTSSKCWGGRTHFCLCYWWATN